MTFVSFCSLYFHRSKFYKKIVPSTWPTIYLHIYIYIHIFIYTLSTRLSIYRYVNEYINRKVYEQIHIFVDELLSTNIPIYSCMFLFREGCCSIASCIGYFGLFCALLYMPTVLCLPFYDTVYRSTAQRTVYLHRQELSVIDGQFCS